ncbi:prepilin peptidase [Candidatus Daviesbacteria bacterium]|nr:prepilin peptidase [Candidatus Daviesbacteria bacterium]
MYLLSLVASGFILGTILGSLTKALADRSLTNGKFLGRSYCPHCKKVLRWYDLLPIVSYLLLKGKCHYCHKNIGKEYLMVELVMGLLIAYLFYQNFSYFNFPLSPLPFTLFFLDLIYKIFFITVLAILFITDLKKMLIPDRIVIPAIIISSIYLIMTTILKIGFLYYSLSQTQIGRYLLPPHSEFFQRHALIAAEGAIGAFLVALTIGGLFLFLAKITGGRGMGGGDVKLGFLMGLGLGFPNALVALMGGFLSGAVVAIILIILGKKHFGQSIPFGPFLVLGSLVALFWGNQIMGWYLRLSFSG